MALLSKTQESSSDLAFAESNASTTEEGHNKSRSPAIGQLPLSDVGNFDKDFLPHPEAHDEEFPGSRRLPTSVPVTTSDHHHCFTADTVVPPKIENNPDDFIASNDTAPYVAIDPFVPSVAKSVANITPSSRLLNMQPQVLPTTDHIMPAEGVATIPTSSYIIAFFLDTLPRQLYLYLLLTLPSHYFSRVSRIFEEAAISMPDIKRMVTSLADVKRRPGPSTTVMLGMSKQYPMPPFDYQVVASFKETWEQFVDTLMKEWKTLNLVTVLLSSAILTTLQIDGAATDPGTRYLAFLALVCSLMSLLYGCIYTIRFNTMRKTRSAAKWAEEGRKTRTSIFWNVWVLLAMPAVWLSWSIIFYFTCVMTFLWRTGTISDAVQQITPRIALVPRLFITFTFVIGLVYLYLIIREFRLYGDAMNKAWRKRVLEWKTPRVDTLNLLGSPSARGMSPSASGMSPFSQIPSEVKPEIWKSAQPFPSHPNWLPPKSGVPFDAIKLVDLRTNSHASYDMPLFLQDRDIAHHVWNRFIWDASQAWDRPCLDFVTHPELSGGASAVQATPQDVVSQLIAKWNVEVFVPRGTQAVLCEEQTDEEQTLLSYAIYLIDLVSSLDTAASWDVVQGEQLTCRFAHKPAGVQRINLYEPVPPYGDIQKAISRPLSDARAIEGSNEDVRNSDDSDEQGDHVPSLSPQPAIGSIRQEPSTVSIQSPEEDHRLSPLHYQEQEISQDERKLNQNDADVEDHLHGWPKDWRPDYGNIIRGLRKFKAPVDCSICLTLSYKSPSRPLVIYDLRFPPNPSTLSFPIIERNYDPADLRMHATTQPVEQIRLCHPMLPWYIDVHQSQPSGVTVGDVVTQMYQKLQLPISAIHHRNTDLDTATRVAMAFQRRTQGNKEELEKGIKRLDYLEDKVIFVGLKKTEGGVWEMKTTLA